MKGRDEFWWGTVYREDDRPPVRPWTGAVWLNLAVSVWVLIARTAYELVDALRHPFEMAEMWGPFAHSTVTWPLVVGSLSLVLWFAAFRDVDPGARLGAAFVALLLLQPVIGMPIAADLYGYPLDWLIWGLFTYVFCSHLAFALLGREH